MSRFRCMALAAYLLFSLTSLCLLPGCDDSKSDAGTQVTIEHDEQKDREQHEVNQKKYMDELKKKNRRR